MNKHEHMTPEELRQAKDRLGLTVTELAGLLGIVPRSVYLRLRGDLAITKGDAALVREALRTPDNRPLCPCCQRRRPISDMRHFDPGAECWIDLPACKPCLCKGRRSA